MRGSSKLRSPCFRLPITKQVCIKAPQRANPTSVAEPIAKPFPTAAVVFPAESRISVLYLTSGSSSLISAIPPALSLIGPYPSIARQMGRFDNIPSAERATPRYPRVQWEQKTTMQRTMMGIMVERYPRAKPQMTFVAVPVLQTSASSLTNLYE